MTRYLIIAISAALIAIAHASFAGIGAVCLLFPLGAGMLAMVVLTTNTSGQWSRTPTGIAAIVGLVAALIFRR